MPRDLGSFKFFEDDTVVASSRVSLYREPRLSRNCALRYRIRGRNKSATSGCEKLCDSWYDSCPGKLSRNASLSLSLPFYFDQLLSLFLSSSPIFSLSLFFCCSLSDATFEKPSSGSNIQAYRFVWHPVGGRSNQSRSRRAVLNPFLTSWDVRVNIMPREIILFTVWCVFSATKPVQPQLHFWKVKLRG